ncbi:MAG TPA: alpha-glucosidase [Alphaproteobacteria bacterium]|nr:alpha-glucosidase [Alphaproteobacteria bacterium]
MSSPWWRGATVYQIYPRSYCDSNGDGVGDIPGIISRLDYVASLGVDAIWLSPIHPSPNRDFGYDVADYTAVAPEFGTMDDFKLLLREAHARGLKVILDQVISHTSDEHPWFVESRSSRDNPKADWYQWAEPKPDGTPPNNWLAVFGGAAWSYWPARRQYYFHKFLRQQPKLNLHNPACRAAVMDVFRFWLDLGVDGFRLDVAHSFLHDALLRDNPAVPMEARRASHWSHAANLQEHLFDNGFPASGHPGPAERAVLDEVRAIVESYPDRFVFGEFAEEPRFLGDFASDQHGAQSGYTFAYLYTTKLSAKIFADHIAQLNGFADTWPCVTLSNHDISRPVTRYSGLQRDDALAKLLLTVLVAHRGTILLYQGEEMGLGDGSVTRAQVRDPFGDLYYPLFKGRDPCRTPMPWRGDAPHAGFTTGTPWLPMAPEHSRQAADRQEADHGSVLNFSRALLAIRKTFPAWVKGNISVAYSDDDLLVLAREGEGQRLIFAFNLSEVDAALPPGIIPPNARVVELPHFGTAKTILAPRSAALWHL